MAFVGQVHLYDSHFFPDFTLDLLLLYRKMGGNQAKTVYESANVVPDYRNWSYTI